MRKTSPISNLRESGAIEQDTDIVCLFIANIIKLQKMKWKFTHGVAELFGQTSKWSTSIARMNFDGEYALFRDPVENDLS